MNYVKRLIGVNASLECRFFFFASAAQVQTDNATKGLARSGMDVLKPQQAPGKPA